MRIYIVREEDRVVYDEALPEDIARYEPFLIGAVDEEAGQIVGILAAVASEKLFMKLSDGKAERYLTYAERVR